jgi:hypothetical protein
MENGSFIEDPIEGLAKHDVALALTALAWRQFVIHLYRDEFFSDSTSRAFMRPAFALLNRWRFGADSGQVEPRRAR